MKKLILASLLLIGCSNNTYNIHDTLRRTAVRTAKFDDRILIVSTVDDHYIDADPRFVKIYLDSSMSGTYIAVSGTKEYGTGLYWVQKDDEFASIFVRNEETKIAWEKSIQNVVDEYYKPKDVLPR